MKSIALVFPILFFFLHSLCQKPIVDTGMLNTWPIVATGEDGIAMSPDGHFAAYVIYNQPRGKSTLTIKQLEGNWEKSIVAEYPSIIFFSADSKLLLFKTEEGLFKLQMGKTTAQLFAGNVDVFYPYELKGKWILLANEKKASSYRLIDLVTSKEQVFDDVAQFEWMDAGKKILFKSPANDLTLLDLSSNHKFTLSKIVDYRFSNNLNEIAYVSLHDAAQVLKRKPLKVGPEKISWIGKPSDRIEQLTYSEDDRQLSFVVIDDKNDKSIWHCRSSDMIATQLINDAELLEKQGLSIESLNYFSAQGCKWIYFSTERSPASDLSTVPTVTSVDIWNYQDDELFPAQIDTRSFRSGVLFAIETTTKQLHRFTKNENCIQAFNDLVLVEITENQKRKSQFQQGAQEYWLYNLKTGSKTPIIGKNKNPMAGVRISTSPHYRWIIYWDQATEDYYSLDSQTGNIVNLTAHLPFKFTDEVLQNVRPIPVGYINWLKNESYMLIFDNYDLWKIDPSGTEQPICLTGEYGRNHGVYLRFMQVPPASIAPGTEVLFTGFNKWTKENSIFSMKWGNSKSLTCLVVGPYNYYQTTIFQQPFNNPMAPLSGTHGKASHWIVLRQSEKEYPNLYYSKDLQHFKPITHLEPHKAVNWLTAEPVIWKMYNGQLNTGVLYKPENFDSTQKYPVIFNYYEKFSQRCYQFPMPGLTTANINIPWFVSRGYLVFTPDIQYSTANVPGGMTITEAAYNAVASAGEFLAQRPYVDKEHMAIQGHSFGAYQTLGILCNSSDRFAAAIEIAGTTDIISSYLTLITGDESPNASLKEDKQDHPQGRMGATPWERPDIYLKSSSVLNAHKIKTPLLMVHNKKDGAINFNQAVEMYMALRRLSKPCWLIQYDNSGHVLTNRKDKLDFTLRLTQYLDHHLKDAPAPLWMTMTHLRQYKDKNNLFALDSTRSCFPGCKACAKYVTPSPTN
ncbi:alpha/beta hydrolase family protein [Paraflavitalea pollutisoli]|uniref:alpha/beta hydrolase family protein n=1 Tax=Paraflavitalea pollutisoli TaxID=3034143 RepID=UPI0023EB2B56|nr:prolyl oligopeptidase family serine peptidase [Paraflavitalea sp. H1-2-19X]